MFNIFGIKTERWKDLIWPYWKIIHIVLITTTFYKYLDNGVDIILVNENLFFFLND